MSEELEQLASIRHSTRPRKINDQFKESYQELKGSSNKKYNLKLDKYSLKKQTTQKKVYDFGYQTEWLDCLYPDDNGTNYSLQIQLGVLKPKRPNLKKCKKEPKDEGILSLIQNLITNMHQPDMVHKYERKQKVNYIENVQENSDGSITVHHSYFKKIEYLVQKPELEMEQFEDDDELATRFNQIKKSFKPLILQ